MKRFSPFPNGREDDSAAHVFRAVQAWQGFPSAGRFAQEWSGLWDSKPFNLTLRSGLSTFESVFSFSYLQKVIHIKLSWVILCIHEAKRERD